MLYIDGGNLLLLFPMGFYLCMFLYTPKIKRVTAAVFLISLFIECLQLTMTFFYFGERIFDINDLLLNTLGGFMGSLLYVSLMGKLMQRIYLIHVK